MKKTEGAPVPLVYPGGQAAGVGEFHETGEQPNTYARFFARYNRGEALVLPGSEAGGGEGVRAQVGGGEGHVETTLSPLLMRAAEDPKGNPWGITLDDMGERQFGGGRMVDLTLMDFQALYGREGLAEAQRRYGTATEPDKPAPPTIDPEKEVLRAKLADEIALRETAEKDLNLAKSKLATAASTVKTFALGLGSEAPVKGGGKYALALRRRSVMLLQIAEKLALLLAILPLLTGCASLRALIPGGVTAADAEFSAVVTGTPKSIIGSLDPRGAPAVAVLEALGVKDPIGVYLPVNKPGETVPMYLLCVGDFAEKCLKVPINSKVRVAGQFSGPGGAYLRLSRLTVD